MRFKKWCKAIETDIGGAGKRNKTMEPSMSKESIWTEARVYTAGIVLCVLIAVVCVITKEWFGVLGSLLGALNAWGARWFLLKWKPSANVE